MTTQHLLVVEDSALQAEMLRDDLIAAGYEVTVASDGRAALDWLEDGGRPDAIVTDVMMPTMNGYDLCRAVKRTRGLEGVPVILLTSLKDPVDIVRGLECGADNFVTKPYERDGLLHRIDTVLRSNDLRLAGRFRMGVEVLVLGHTFTVSADRQQILDMLMSSFEELVNTNDRLREREEQLETTQAALQAQVQLAEERGRELEGSRNELRHLLDETQVATWSIDFATDALHWSPNAHEILGVSDATQVATLEGLLNIMVEEDAAVIRGLVEKLVDCGEMPDEWTFRVRDDDGRLRTFSSRGHTLTDGSTLVGVSGLMLDITRRRELEDQLAAREQMLSGIVGASPDGIVVTGLDGTIRFASDGMRDLLGLEPEELVGQDPRDHIHDGDRDAATAAVRGLFDRRAGVTQVRLHVPHADGHLATVDARVRLLTTGDGIPDGFVTVVRDVTDQAALEAELERARDEAETANRAKSDYLSRMSHELRTPMNSVLGFAQLLQLADLPEQDRDSVDRILRAGRHLLQLIDDVLDIARIEAGHLTISLEAVAVDEVVDHAVELLRPQWQNRDIDVTVDVERPLHMLADNQRLSQVLINLLSNAIKYNQHGGRVTVSGAAPADGWCRLAVSDTGPGIHEEHRDRLFQTFDRLDADHGEVSGTGLGLALSKTLVEAMGGRIGCDSEPGVGSTFWVDLPPANFGDGTEEEGNGHVDTGDRTADQRPASLLYVEDNPLNVELVQRALATRPGTELRHAGSGDVGLQMAHEQRPDLVLLDLQLPGMSGRDVLRHLRTDPVLRDVPVVVLSADATMDTAQAVQDGGADAYLTKPLDLAALHRTIDDLLRRPVHTTTTTGGDHGHGPRGG